MTEVKTHIELPISGMTCASCAARIEKRLNKLDGVEANVNYATEKATLDYDSKLLNSDDLIKAVEEVGYKVVRNEENSPDTSQGSTETKQTQFEQELFSLKQRLIVSAVLGLPVLLLSMIPILQFRNWQWASLTLTAPVVIWGGLPFHKATWLNLRHRAATMDTLISIGTISAFIWSLWALFVGHAGDPGMKMEFSFSLDQHGGNDHIYLEVAAVVIVFLLAGRYFEARAKNKSGSAIAALLELGSKDVAILDDNDKESIVPIDQLKKGDRFAVRPGEKIATDGQVLSGNSVIDVSLLTGESVPVEVAPGDDITGATINVGGYLIVKATRVGSDTTLAQIRRLVNDAQSGKAPMQRLADKVSSIFVPIVLVLAVLTLAGWLISGSQITYAFSAGVAVLIVACPCALGLATPTALLVGVGRGAQLGILVKGPLILEQTRKIDTIVLDKTGTVTTGVMTMVGLNPGDGVSEEELLKYGGSLEKLSEHPIGKAIANTLEEKANFAKVENFVSHQAAGVSGKIDGVEIVAGKFSLLEQYSMTISAELKTVGAKAESEGYSVVYVGWDGKSRGVISVADEIKPTSEKAITRLHQLGLHTVLLTGDNEIVAKAVAKKVGIEEVIAGALPSDKVDIVKSIQQKGHVVAMVGDGVNDAAALAQADLGIAMGSGTDVAIEASDLTLIRSDLLAVSDAIFLSRRTLGTIKGNLFWAFAYNVGAIPLAALGFLNPLLAGGAMVFSSVFVVSNSLRLRSFRPTYK